MKIKNFTFLIIAASALFFASCESAKNENAALNATAPAANKTAQSGAGGSNSTNASAENTPKPKATSDAKENGNFEGTSGIIDKKREIKGAALLKEIRSARHDFYDRVVFEFAGAEMPGYHIEYIDKPVRACGSGDVVPLKGDGWLEIRFYPANAHTEEGKPTLEKREFAPNHPIIREMKQTCDFEAVVTWVLGVSSPNHYRVLELENPTRLAVDVKHK